ncbi:MAG: hypothetical protein JRI91_06360 [Deltaproteobacteria bacterium]|nr:hypothetical protein [Deltaproteobacteria bacterium]
MIELSTILRCLNSFSANRKNRDVLISIKGFIMDKKSFHFFIGILAFLIFSGSIQVAAQENNNRIYVQGLMGTMRLYEGDFTFEGEPGSDESVVFEGDSIDIPYLGFSMQQVLGGDRLKYGVEGGFLASWKTEKWQVAVSNGTAYVHIKNSMFLGDLFFGGYTSMNIGKRIRLYLGGGPLLIYGQRKIDPEENYSSNESSIIYESTYESEWNV